MISILCFSYTTLILIIGPLSPFGWDFAHNNHYWNLCLACADSDNDGFPNGWELGDPCGYWSTHSKAVPCWKDDISHPGNASSVPLTRTVDWLGTCGYNPCENSDIVQCVAYLDTQRPHHGIQMNLHLQDKESSSTTTTTALRGNNGESVSSSSLLKNIHQHQPEQTKSSLSPDIVTIQNHQLTLLEEIQGQEQSSVHTDTSILAHDPPPQPKCGRYNPRPSHQP